MNAAEKIQPPALGEVWPGQGGIYAGFMPARGQAEGYHMIVAAEDIGRFEWGPYGDDSPATSLIDGKANTAALVESGSDYPAAQAAAAYTADGHTDFYLASTAELYEIWLSQGAKIEGWLWSSSQRSADTAYTMGFGDGYQYDLGKGYELRVRPVRRFIC